MAAKSRYTQDMIQTVVQMDRNGATAKLIAEKVGLRATQVVGILARYRDTVALDPEKSTQTTQIVETGLGNQREIDSWDQRITTLEQLIAFCKVDLDTWIIERHVVNKWEVGAKNPMTATGVICEQVDRIHGGVL